MQRAMDEGDHRSAVRTIGRTSSIRVKQDRADKPRPNFQRRQTRMPTVYLALSRTKIQRILYEEKEECAPKP